MNHIMTNRHQKNKIAYKPEIIGLLICCLMCFITLFVSSHRFVNMHTTPKWLGLLLGTGIINFVWGSFRKVYYSSQSHFVILISCFCIILLRDWATSNL